MLRGSVGDSCLYSDCHKFVQLAEINPDPRQDHDATSYSVSVIVICYAFSLQGIKADQSYYIATILGKLLVLSVPTFCSNTRIKPILH